MPADVVFLEKKVPLADQVAQVLLPGERAGFLDLGDTQVWIPTSGAGRRIRYALAKRAAGWKTGVLAPQFLLPMQALLPQDPGMPLASRPEREAAWARVLREAPESERDELIPKPEALKNAAGWLGVGGQLCDLCDLLIDGGYDPLHPEVAKVCAEDGARWEQLRVFYQKYLAFLASVGRLDPNVARLQTLAWPLPVKDLRRIVVACIPDLSVASVRYLARLQEQGIRVEVLIWNPGALAAGWDEWGRPLKKDWAAATLPLVAEQMKIARQPADEASLAVDFLAKSERAGDFALALADETLAATFATEIAQRDGVPFLPDGEKLSASEPAMVALEWEKFRSGGDLRVLRTLLQKPWFLRWLGNAAQLMSSQLLAACDFLITEPLAETLEQAESFLASPEPPKRRALENPARAHAASMLQTLRRWRALEFAEVLREAWASASETAERDAVAQVLQRHRDLALSPVFTDWAEAIDPAFSRILRSEKIYSTAPAGSVELLGWLETPWMDVTRLAICGCVEGKWPGSVNEHAFLPDSKRQALGLLDNAGRFARDAYLLSCLMARHGAADLQLSFSKFGADGSPALPSRLLLQTGPEMLPERVLQTFGPGTIGRTQPARRNDWLWRLPEKFRQIEITKISPTGFSEYLACPFRFFWKHILRLDDYDPDPREMDARTFGVLVHSTLEAFGNTAPDEPDAVKIEGIVLELFEKEALRIFGTARAPAIRVQLEALKVRLRAFARVQAEERAAGWKIIEVERKFSAETISPLKIGSLNLSAQIDRIERHPEFGLRIMDYKTSSTFAPPEKKHFGPKKPDHFLPESQVTWKGKEKSWVDLQLPLYHFIAASTFPDARIQTAYFSLPADPDQTQVAPLELDEEEYQSALRCAAAVADRVQRGIFWPPQSVRGNWSDPCAALFLNGAPEDCLDAATIEFLKGRP